MFWESVLPTTAVIFILLFLLSVGFYLLISYDGKVAPANLKMCTGAAMVALALSFIFACFGWAAGQ